MSIDSLFFHWINREKALWKSRKRKKIIIIKLIFKYKSKLIYSNTSVYVNFFANLKSIFPLLKINNVCFIENQSLFQKSESHTDLNDPVTLKNKKRTLLLNHHYSIFYVKIYNYF